MTRCLEIGQSWKIVRRKEGRFYSVPRTPTESNGSVWSCTTWKPDCSVNSSWQKQRPYVWLGRWNLISLRPFVSHFDCGQWGSSKMRHGSHRRVQAGSCRVLSGALDLQINSNVLCWWLQLHLSRGDCERVVCRCWVRVWQWRWAELHCKAIIPDAKPSYEVCVTDFDVPLPGLLGSAKQFGENILMECNLRFVNRCIFHVGLWGFQCGVHLLQSAGYKSLYRVASGSNFWNSARALVLFCHVAQKVWYEQQVVQVEDVVREEDVMEGSETRSQRKTDFEVGGQALHFVWALKIWHKIQRVKCLQDMSVVECAILFCREV